MTQRNSDKSVPDIAKTILRKRSLKKPDPQMAERIRTVRILAGLSQADLARRLGLDRGYLSQVETGATLPSDWLILRICMMLQISYRWIVDGEGKMEADWIPDNMIRLNEDGQLTSELKVILIAFEDMCFELAAYQKKDLAEGITTEVRKQIYNKDMSDVKTSIFNILGSMDDGALRDLCVLLAAKANRLTDPEKEKIANDIERLKRFGEGS